MTFFIEYLICVFSAVIPLISFVIGLTYLCTYLEKKIKQVFVFIVFGSSTIMIGFVFIKWIRFLVEKLV